MPSGSHPRAVAEPPLWPSHLLPYGRSFQSRPDRRLERNRHLIDAIVSGVTMISPGSSCEAAAGSSGGDALYEGLRGALVGLSTPFHALPHPSTSFHHLPCLPRPSTPFRSQVGVRSALSAVSAWLIACIWIGYLLVIGLTISANRAMLVAYHSMYDLYWQPSPSVIFHPFHHRPSPSITFHHIRSHSTPQV